MPYPSHRRRTETIPTDPDSTGCLLSAFANMIHEDRLQFHPCAIEDVMLVREGYGECEEEPSHH